jgi:hypothetical protein
MNLREVNMKYGRIAVFIRHNYADIYWLRYRLTLGTGTLKMMASTGVFVLLVRALKLLISGHGRQLQVFFRCSLFSDFSAKTGTES